MSDLNDHAGSEENTPLFYRHRTTHEEFQERLLRAQEQARDEALDVTDDAFLSYDEKTLQKQLEKYKEQVERVENRVKTMEDNLSIIRARKTEEAGITNMTPEERAAYFEQQEKKALQDMKLRERQRERLKAKAERKEAALHGISNDMDDDLPDIDDEEEESNPEDIKDTKEPDWDVVYEYLLLLQSTPAGNLEGDVGADLGGADTIDPDSKLRKRAFNHQEVLRQSEFSHIKILSAKNVIENNTETNDDIRHCEITGTSFDQKFGLQFDVIEPRIEIAKVDFTVDFQMQLDIADVLNRLKKEHNIMGFFRLLVHYSAINHQRLSTFKRLKEYFNDTPVTVDDLSAAQLQFSHILDTSMTLTFTWQIIPCNLQFEYLDANIENHVVPVLSIEVEAIDEIAEKDQNGLLRQVDKIFKELIKQHGVYNAAVYVIEKTYNMQAA